MPYEKVCSKCQKEKPLSEYYNQYSCLNGKSSACKECRREISRNRNKKLREERDKI